MLDSAYRTYRSDNLDLIRAFLAFYVMIGHVTTWTNLLAPESISAALVAFRRGSILVFQGHGETNPAVLAFIALSGYCIHRAGFRRDNLDLKRYSIRRFFRIYPVYILAIAIGLICWVAAMAANPAAAQMMSGTKLISAECLWARISGSAAFYPPQARCFVGNTPLSTVMVEMWLYVVYPILFVFLLRYGEKKLWILVFAVWCVGVTLVTVQPQLTYWWNNASLIGYLAFWWIGAKAIDPNFRSKVQANFLSLLVVWVALTVLLMWADGSAPTFLVELRKIIYAVIVATIISFLDTPNEKPRWLSIFGRSGYSLYAFHAPIIYLLLVLTVPWWAAVFCAVIVGLLIYWFYERPLMLFGRNLARSEAADGIRRTI